MNNLINIINKLQEICVTSNINSKIQLPQIVVVGSQSSGKTSILEAVVGKDFLPRGNGIVTRRPLILQLKNTSCSKEWAEFLHLGKEKLEDFSKVHDEIEKETYRVAGNNKAISSEPIILKIFSPNLVDLTLVDLPGLVKVPIGDQPENIDQLVRNLLLDYASNPNAIILAITPGNSDIANSDALKLAKEVDPYYQRTLGVITKMDLMEHGTESIEILTNKVYPLKYGYIGVVLRSQKETNSKKSIQEALLTEQEFFDNHGDLKTIKHLLGIKTLTKNLSTILMEHIKTNLPGIRETISTEIYVKEKELNIMGVDNGFDRADVLNSYVLMLVFKFANTYKEIIDGNLIKECSKYYIGGARINYIFQDIFRKEINSIDPYDTLTDDDIRTAIKNTNGLKPSLFIPETAFEVLIKQQILRFTNPSLSCVKKVYDELKNIVVNIELPELGRYKKFETRIKQIMENVLDRCLEPTNQMISNLIDIEQAYINTSHPDFLGPEQSFINIFDDSSNNNSNLSGNNQSNNLTGTNTNSSFNHNNIQVSRGKIFIII
jgi:replication fork clamp-binding protein CrfC